MKKLLLAMLAGICAQPVLANTYFGSEVNANYLTINFFSRF